MTIFKAYVLVFLFIIIEILFHFIWISYSILKYQDDFEIEVQII